MKKYSKHIQNTGKGVVENSKKPRVKRQKVKLG